MRHGWSPDRQSANTLAACAQYLQFHPRLCALSKHSLLSGIGSLPQLPHPRGQLGFHPLGLQSAYQVKPVPRGSVCDVRVRLHSGTVKINLTVGQFQPKSRNTRKGLGPAAASASDGVQNTVIIYKRNPARSLQQLVKRAPDQKDPEQFLDTNLVVTPIKEQAPQRVWSLRSGPPELSINMDHGSYPSGSSCRVTP